MGVALQQWRAAIGCFAQPGSRKDDPGPLKEDESDYSYTRWRTAAGLAYVLLAIVIMITRQGEQ